MRYQHTGGLPLEIEGQRIEPGTFFVADLGPLESFLMRTGAIARAEPERVPEPQSFAVEEAPRARKGKES